MLVKKIYTAEELRNEFCDYGRDDYSLEGYQAIIDLFDECDCGMPRELDVIGICCDYDEETPADIAEERGIDITDCDDDDEIMETVLEYINRHSYGIDLGNGNILYQAF